MKNFEYGAIYGIYASCTMPISGEKKSGMRNFEYGTVLNQEYYIINIKERLVNDEWQMCKTHDANMKKWYVRLKNYP